MLAIKFKFQINLLLYEEILYVIIRKYICKL